MATDVIMVSVRAGSSPRNFWHTHSVYYIRIKYRGVAMAKIVVLVTAVLLLFLLACSSDPEVAGSKESADAVSSTSPSARADERVIASQALAAPAFAPPEAGVGGVASGQAMQTLQRKVISSASVSIKVNLVEEAVTQIRTIAEGMGGFVEQLSSSGAAARQQASMTVRVPQAQFFTALERIEALGEVQSKNLGTEDVSEQFIDLEARLTSSLREEESLLSLLGRSGTVSEVLAIERELARVRAEVERWQGQLNFLERRVDLATITVSLFPPQKPLAQPPSGNLSMEVEDVGGSLDAAKGFVLSVDGVVEQVFLSQRDGKESADLTLAVRTADFDRVMGFLEAQGKIKTKEIREGTVQEELGDDPDRSLGAASLDEEPEARIELLLLEEDGSLNSALTIGIIVAIGVAVVLVIMVLVLNGIAWATRGPKRTY